MGMYDTVTRLKKKIGWKHTHEFTHELLILTQSGKWRYEDNNGGERGAWEKRADRACYISPEEVVLKLREWGVDEDEIAEVESLAPYTYAPPLEA